MSLVWESISVQVRTIIFNAFFNLTTYYQETLSDAIGVDTVFTTDPVFQLSTRTMIIGTAAAVPIHLGVVGGTTPVPMAT